MNVFAIADNYEAMVQAFRDRRMALGLSQTDVDLLADLPGGYTAKCELSLTNPTARNARSIGKESLPKLLRTRTAPWGVHRGGISAREN